MRMPPSLQGDGGRLRGDLRTAVRGVWRAGTEFALLPLMNTALESILMDIKYKDRPCGGGCGGTG
jgi:hypothetical protein